MLSIVRCSTGMAGSYYTKDDYYLKDVGTWSGSLAKELKLSEVIQEQDFRSLVEGKIGQQELTGGGKDNKHTAGVDLTFSAPKSVSILGLVADDKQIIEAHDKAVQATLDYIEKNYTNVRIKQNGKVSTEETGNMLVAKFQHVASRELDPQLHTHCLVFNMTKKENGDIRAMDYKEMYDNKMFLGQMYRNELAFNLKELGYSIVADSKGLFELAGVDKDIMKAFSSRSEQIKARMETLQEQFPNATNAKLKAMATLDTRKRKDEPSMEELRQDWNSILKEYSINKDMLAQHAVNYKDQISIRNKIINLFSKVDENKLDKTMQQAIKIATEHEAVVNKEDILRIAGKLSVGEYRISDIEIKVQDVPNLINLTGKNYTTKEIALMESNIVNVVQNNKNIQDSLMMRDHVDKSIVKYELNHQFNLTGGQKNAVRHILTSRDGIIAIQGDAGTGKTTMLDVVRTVIDNRHEIVGLSFTGKAAGEIQEASGIESRTIASLINSRDDLYGKLVVVDEASMLSIRDMDALIKKCDKDTKLVLIGDTKQLQSIGQGKIFSSLQEKHIIEAARMSEVQRQNDIDYKSVVDDLNAKRIVESINKLDNNNKIIENAIYQERLNIIKDKYFENPKTSIIVTATNKDRVELNGIIRERLIEQGIVNNNGKEISTIHNKTIIGEEKNYADSYTIGDIINANKAGILGKIGTEGVVCKINDKKHILLVKADNQNIYKVDLKENGQNISVYKKENIEFVQGEKIIFLKNDRNLGVKNGQTAIVESIKKDGILSVTMDNGHKIEVDTQKYKYLDYGYALTDYKSQGQTAKHVIYHADTNANINFNQAYVGITRGKESVHIVTDDKVRMVDLIQKPQEKTSTLDYNAKIKDIENELKQIARNTPTIKENIILEARENLNQKAMENKQNMGQPQHHKSPEIRR